MRQSRGHLAHGGQTGDMDKLGLQFLQPGFRLLAFGQVADEAGEKTPVARSHFADCKLHRKSRSVLALADNDPPDPDDPSLAGAQVSLQVAVVALTIR